MPTLRTSEVVRHLSPRFLLLARCEACNYFISWVHQGWEGTTLYGTCCWTVWKAEAIDDAKTQFAVTHAPVGGTNVIIFPPFLRARVP